MPQLHNIVEYINEQVRAKLDHKSFSGSMYHGIAVVLPRGEQDQWMPCVVNHDDNNVWVSVDDSYPLIAYHKNNGVQSIIDGTKNYGNSQIVVEQASMQMIVFSSRSRVPLTPEDLYAGILSGLPLKVPFAKADEWNLRAVDIYNVQPTFDFVTLYQQEHRAITYTLAPNMNYFAINYSIKIKYDKACFDVCDCLTS